MKKASESGAISVRTSLPWLGLILIAAAAVVYGKLGGKSGNQDSKTPDLSIRTAVVRDGDVDNVIRLSGTISAEKFNGLIAPRLSGNRGNGGSSSSSGSSSSGGSSSGSASTGSSSSSSTTGGSTTSSTSTSTNTSNSSASATGAQSSLGAIRGTTNRFGDRTAAQKAGSSTTSASSGTSSTANSNTSGRGSTASALIGIGQRGFSPSDGDFNLVLIHVVPPGSHVKKGQIVAEFDRQNQINRLDDYKASVIQLDANVKKLKADLAVAKEAHEQLIRSAKADQDKAELDLKTAPVRSAIEAESLQLAVEEAQAHYKQIAAEAKLVEDSQRAQIRAAEIDRDRSKIEFERAQKNVDRMVMRAPLDGVAVMQSIFRGGDFGQVQQGDQIWPGMQFMQVVDPSSMVITASVNQVDAEAVQIGMKAVARIDAYPGLELPAHVIGIGAMTKPGVWRPNYMREIPVRLKLDRMDARVIPDVSASADIYLGGEKNVRVLPVNSVFHDSPAGKPYVFLRSPEGWEKREVELGMANRINVAVHSGVQNGQVIALERPSSDKQ